jgi:hypothetical protein
VLANEVLVVVVPVTETEYAVGAVTEIEDGIVKVIRRVEPTMVVTAEDGVVLTGEPMAEGFIDTVTPVD